MGRTVRRVPAPPPGKGRAAPSWGPARGAHRGVARGAVGAVNVRVLQWQLLPVLPGGIHPVEGIGVSPEERGW